jgi:hypothetical protein
MDENKISRQTTRPHPRVETLGMRAKLADRCIFQPSHTGGRRVSLARRNFRVARSIFGLTTKSTTIIRSSKATTTTLTNPRQAASTRLKPRALSPRSCR